MNLKDKIEEFVSIVVREGGSDLHLSSGRRPAIRVSGQLIFLENQEVFSNDDILQALEQILGPERTKLFVKNQEADFSWSSAGGMRLRGNAFIHKGNFALAFRLIPKVRTLAELNLPQSLEIFARKKQGFFLVVGPVGHGKSTTLAAMIDMINHERTEHIITIEDPIEYVFEPDKSIIDQREVGIDTINFESALQSSFRQDVNVLMIGEMRNPETMAAAVTAAETGHLVLSTLHTNNASQTIDRIIDSFPSGQQDQIRIQLASSLLGIFSQRLIPKVVGGLVPSYELLINNNAIENLIREHHTHEIDVVIETGFESGMVDMNRSLIELVRKGEITMENAMLHSLNPKALEKFA